MNPSSSLYAVPEDNNAPHPTHNRYMLSSSDSKLPGIGKTSYLFLSLQLSFKSIIFYWESSFPHIF